MSEVNVQRTAGEKRKLSPRLKRALLLAAGAVLLLALLLLGHYLARYSFNYKYKRFLPEKYTVETAADFKPLSDDEPSVEGYALVAQNETLKLYANRKTGEIAVYDRRNGVTVYSNPPDADADAVANKTNRDYLRSQFILNYFNAGRTAGMYDSYSMCVDKDQLTAQSIENGVRFVYELGETRKLEYFVPTYLSDSWFAAACELADESGKSTMERMYIPDDKGLRTLIKAAANNRRSQAKLDKLLQAAGFTEADYLEQMALGGEEQAEPMSFSVTLDYRLVGDALEVSIPVSELQERGGGKIYRIQLLRYLGAAGGDESGYMLVPNGCGSLIDFNNGKTASAAYSQYIYDMDLMDADYTKTQNTVPARLPLYAICREQSSVLATVEDGATLCFLTADVAGRYNSYNYAYPTFYLRGYDTLYMFGVSGTEADMPILEKDLYDENLTVKYTLLTADNAGYSGAARYYRDRLISEGALTRSCAEGDIPLYCDVIGGVKQTAHFLGVQYLRVYPMTTFAEAGDIAVELNALGVGNTVINMQGWFNGGYFHDVPDRVSTLWELGGKEGLQALNDRLTSLGGELYADVAFQNVTSISKRFASSREGSRYYGAGYTAILGQVNPGTLRRTSSLGYQETLYSLLSPRYLPEYVEAFADAIRGFELSGISLRDLGYELHADKRRTNVITREQALHIVTAQIDALASTGKDIMLSGGNLYALKTAKHVLNAPMTATDFYITDKSVPFYQMVTHGCVEYAGGLQNEVSGAGDDTARLLKLVEYGASLHYVFTMRDATQMKYTGLNSRYATDFAVWKDGAASAYAYVNAALKPVRGALMLAHDELAGGVSRVSYDNGITLYVNYNDAPVVADGHTVPAKAYLSVGGDGQ